MSKLAEPNLINSAGLPTAPFHAGRALGNDSPLLNIPESRSYKLIYDLDLGNLGGVIIYQVDNTHLFKGTFDRIAYFVELKDDNDTSQWVYVAMDAFTNDLSKIGIPVFNSEALFQQRIENLLVRSNVPGLPNKDVLAGNIEFWPNNYGKFNADKIPGAFNDTYDIGDSIDTHNPDVHGSMQIHLIDYKTTVFALNNWKHSPSDLGIGTNMQGSHPDWTHEQSSDRYAFKRMKVLVHPDGK